MCHLQSWNYEENIDSVFEWNIHDKTQGLYLWNHYGCLYFYQLEGEFYLARKLYVQKGWQHIKKECKTVCSGKSCIITLPNMLNQRRSRHCPFLLAWQGRQPLRTTGEGGGHRQTGKCNVGETEVTDGNVIVGGNFRDNHQRREGYCSRVLGGIISSDTAKKAIVQERRICIKDGKVIIGEKG